MAVGGAGRGEAKHDDGCKDCEDDAVHSDLSG